MKHVYALIMAGGKGQRMWPASRLKNPKHLLSLWGKKTMLERTIDRICPEIENERIYVITSPRYKDAVRTQVPNLGKENLILEPFGRNTAACIGLAALWLLRRDPDSLMVVLPSDHVIKNKGRFHQVLSRAIGVAQKKGTLVTLGIIPRFPATGFGYIRLGRIHRRDRGVLIFEVAKFIEKPDIKTAQRFIRTGRYLWNAGIFVWKTKSILQSIQKFMPVLYDGLARIDRTIGRKRYWSLLEREYRKFEDISIDKGVLERSKEIYVVKSDLKWDDIGSWSSLDYLGTPDKEKNIILAEHFGIDSKDSILVSDKGHLLATIGIRGLIVIQTKDATLICQKQRAQEIKELVRRLGASRRFKKYT